MVKKDVPKPAAKKKASTSKKTKPKKAVKVKGTTDKDVKGQGTLRKKAAPSKKAAAKRKPKAAPKRKPSAKPKAKKAAPTRKKKVSVADLLLKKFDTGVLGELAAKSPYKPKAPAKIPDAPPFVTGRSEEETQQIKKLLLKHFDLQAEPIPTKPKKVVAPKKEKVSVADLLLKKFDTGVLGELAAKSPYKPKAPAKIPDAPPFVTGHDEKETQRIRALLLRQFELRAEPVQGEVKEPKPPELPTEPTPGRYERPKYEPPDYVLTTRPHPTAKLIKGGLWGLAFLLAITIVASFSNRAKFHFKNVDGAVQLWRGKFAPSGTEIVVSVDGAEMPNPAHSVYSQSEAYRIVSRYFQDKADSALNKPGGPDFAKIREYLKQAAAYAPTKDLQEVIQLRLNGMDFLVLLYRADIALTKGTLPDLQAAKAHLEKARSFASMDYQIELLDRRHAVIEGAIAALPAQ